TVRGPPRSPLFPYTTLFRFLAQRGIGLGEDADEVLDLERIELDADREATLQLRDQFGRLRHVKRARSDEQNMVRPHDPVLGADSAAFRSEERRVGRSADLGLR